jgi:nucleotide-binding universal stress UspA family protein
MSDTMQNTKNTSEKPVHRILVATDFSEDSRAALVWACHYAEWREAELFLLHVVHDPAGRPGFYRNHSEDLMQPMQEVAENMMDQFLEETAEGYPQLTWLDQVQTRLVSGLPPTRIVEVADLLKTDLIAIGSRGTTELPNRLRGSTRERVVELAKPPVVVVRSKDPGKPSKKELKQQEKRLKKDRKRLKKMLRFEPNKQTDDSSDG